MNKLPYFLELIKQNLIIATIISTGTFTNVDLKDIEHLKWTDSAIEFKNFPLGKDEIFPSVMVTVMDSSTLIILSGSDHKYFEKSSYYFGSDSTVQKKKPYYIDGNETRTLSKSFGEYRLLNKNVRVSVKQSNIYECAIFLNCKQN